MFLKELYWNNLSEFRWDGRKGELLWEGDWKTLRGTVDLHKSTEAANRKLGQWAITDPFSIFKIALLS